MKTQTIKTANAAAFLNELAVVAGRLSVRDEERDNGALQDILKLMREHGMPIAKECTGEAHSNPNIDNCGVCTPQWGWCAPQVVLKHNG